MPYKASDRIERLDVLRALAALGVFLFHFSLYPAQNGEVTGWAFWTITTVGTFGDAGVALFFVISGFCIHSGFLTAKRAFNSAPFFRRRFVRLYPTYLVVLIVFSLCGLLHYLRWENLSHYFPSVNLKMFLAHLFLVHNFFDLELSRSIDTPMWSLAVEAQFYALFPLLLWARSRWKLNLCLAFSFSWVILYQLACLAWPSLAEMTQTECMLGRTLFTWCTWILGARLAECHARGERFFSRSWFMLIGAFAVLILGRALPIIFELRFCCEALFGAVLLEHYIHLTSNLNRLERWLVPVGLASYSIYLWHMPLLKVTNYFLHRALPLPLQMAPFLYLVLSFVLLSPVFIASYFLLERRFSRWVGEQLFGRAQPKDRTVPDLDHPLPESGK